jgi:energy-coupling factor transport system permease protein
VLVLGITMFGSDPVCLCLSLAAALAYCVYRKGAGAWRFVLRCVLPLVLLTAVVNPAFNHRGATILCYLPSGNPLTLESIVYGAFAGGMLAAVLCWFSGYNAVMTSDKHIYLFGRIIPSLSLVLSMALRFVPRFTAQMRETEAAQRGIGRGVHDAKGLQKLKNAVAVFSIMLTRSLEDAAGTSDSMRARGYGLPGRSAYSNYRFDTRDGLVLAWLCLSGGYVIAALAKGALHWGYFPVITSADGAYAASARVCFFALCSSPLAINLWEDRKWTQLKSKI